MEYFTYKEQVDHIKETMIEPVKRVHFASIKLPFDKKLKLYFIRSSILLVNVLVDFNLSRVINGHNKSCNDLDRNIKTIKELHEKWVGILKEVN